MAGLVRVVVPMIRPAKGSLDLFRYARAVVVHTEALYSVRHQAQVTRLVFGGPRKMVRGLFDRGSAALETRCFRLPVRLVFGPVPLEPKTGAFVVQCSLWPCVRGQFIVAFPHRPARAARRRAGPRRTTALKLARRSAP